MGGVRRPTSASGPGCVKTPADFRFGAAVGGGDPSQRIFQFSEFRTASAGISAGFRVLCGGSARYGRKLEQTSA